MSLVVLSADRRGWLMNIAQEIEFRLTSAFHPTALTVTNESHLHAGHGGDDGSGESHFAIHIRAEPLAALSRLARHRAVQKALGDLNTRIHAIALDIG
jgi:BolA family transcriptional regulator, general stress-responsive regulator